MTEGMREATLKQILAEIRFNMLLDTKLLFHPGWGGVVRRAFGAEYENYCLRVGRWLPKRQ